MGCFTLSCVQNTATLGLDHSRELLLSIDGLHIVCPNSRKQRIFGSFVC